MGAISVPAFEDEEPPPPNDADYLRVNGFDHDHEALKANGTQEAKPKLPRVVWHDADAIFAPLPPIEWAVEGLQLTAGRVNMLNALGNSAKSMAAQDMALSIAAGSLVFGHFSCTRGPVKHLDYEQGLRASARRYQRLAIGKGLSVEDVRGNLSLSSFPELYANSDDAYEAFMRECDGVQLVILDAFIGSVPGAKENESGVRMHLDVLSRVSERTSCTFLMLHHSAKPPKDGASDKRLSVRGSGAIFDACGAVYFMSNQGKDKPRLCEQIKPPAIAGAEVPPFLLAIEDVEVGGHATAGVRVAYRPVESVEAEAKPDKYEADAAKLIAAVQAEPGITQSRLVLKAGIKKTRALAVLAELVEEGRLADLPGPKNSRTYRPTEES